MRSYPDRPVVGVGAVVFDGDLVLLVKRGRPPLEGQWSLPGGGVELGETLATAVEREVREETGLNVSAGALVEVVDRIHEGDRGIEYHFVVVDYLCSLRTAKAGQAELAAGSDAADARWVPIGELEGLGVSPVAISVVRKGRRLFELADHRNG